MNRRILWLIVLGGLLLRFGWAALHPEHLTFDSKVYFRMAEDFVSGRYAGQRVPPVYPLFLSLTYCLLGQKILLTLFVQSCVSALAIVLVYRVGTRFDGELTGLIAAAWAAVDPFLLYYNSLFLSETLFTTLLLAAFLALLKATERSSRGWGLTCGVLLGVGGLCRGMLVPSIPFFVLALYGFSRLPTRKRIVNAFLCFACLAIPILGWSVYVHHYDGVWIMVDSHKGETLYWGLNPQLGDPDSQDRYLADMRRDIAERGLKDKMQIDAYLRNKSLDYIRHHPAQFLLLAVRKFFKFWSVIPHRGFFSPAQRWVSAIFMIPLLLAAILGFWVKWRARRFDPPLLMALGLVLIYTLTNLLFWTEIRFRVPIHPFLEIFAASGVAYLVRKSEFARRGRGFSQSGFS